MRRVNACIKHQLDKEICKLYGGEASSTYVASSIDLQLVYPNQGWLRITKGFATAAEGPQFTMGYIEGAYAGFFKGGFVR